MERDQWLCTTQPQAMPRLLAFVLHEYTIIRIPSISINLGEPAPVSEMSLFWAQIREFTDD
jgi:hypothetical protein